MKNPELVAKMEQWLNDVSAALRRLRREREVLRETSTQIMMDNSNRSRLPAHIVARPR